ncbi:unnamed protein product [Meloidogyne enterolobii]|uniref:Uncharacterized protein n=1 Tax=Meloidogyne enterolobii TaxID=390850 RepID=A0ACB1B1H3_MELEN
MLEELDLKEMSMGNDSNQGDEASTLTSQQNKGRSFYSNSRTDSSNNTTISAPISNHPQSMSSQWSGTTGPVQPPNSPIFKQRERNVSSASDSSQATSSDSPSQTFLQLVPSTPSTYSSGIITATGGGGTVPISPVSES